MLFRIECGDALLRLKLLVFFVFFLEKALFDATFEPVFWAASLVAAFEPVFRAAFFDAAGWPCGRIGSVGYDTGGTTRDAERTTPEAPEVQALLREMVQHRRAACAMEVSSHALAMRRVEGTRFAAAVFSNLTRDHLDYHLDMEHYFGMKRRLFDMLPAGAPAMRRCV